MAKRLGIVPYLYAQPLVHGLKYRTNAVAEPVFDYVEDQYAHLALQLRQGKLDGAFLSPIEYAKDYAQWKIIPRLGVVSEGESQSVMLVLKEQIRNLRTVAVDPAFPSEIVLSNIVLKEKYDMAPQFIPIASTVGEALTKADAVLAVDRETFAVREHRTKLDLVDEWFDLTEMSFVHGLWITREHALTSNEVNALIASAQSTEALPDISSQEKDYLDNFRFELDDEAIASLNEFFRMAYYHGVLSDIPDVRIHSLDKE